MHQILQNPRPNPTINISIFFAAKFLPNLSIVQLLKCTPSEIEWQSKLILPKKQWQIRIPRRVCTKNIGYDSPVEIAFSPPDCVDPWRMLKSDCSLNLTLTSIR